MEKEDKEKIFKILKKYDELRFCLLIILYYHRNVNKIIDLNQMISKESKYLLNDLPSGIIKLLKIYDFENIVKLIEEDKLREIFEIEQKYLNKNIKSIFSLWKILFYQFASLSAIDSELLEEVFSELNIIRLEELNKLLYVGENFNENSLSELLFILVQIKNFKEIHIINYDEGSINLKKCLKNVRDDLFYVEQNISESMMNKIIIIEDAQLNFDYLNTYFSQNVDEKFIIVIGMERFIEFKNNSEINVRLMEARFNLSTSENMNWSLLLDRINKMYALIKEKNIFLLTVYCIDNPIDDAKQKICLYYRDSMFFGVLFDQTSPIFSEAAKNRRIYEELLNMIFNDSNAYEKILEHEGELSKENFIVLKAYYFLFQNDYFHAISELEQLSDDADRYSKFLLAELYNITGKTETAYAMLKNIYEKDKYFPNIVDAIIYSLRYSEDRDEQLLWIRKGLEINPNNPVMVKHLANYYTMKEDYLESAKQWKILYKLTDDLFDELLYEINLILYAADKKQMNNICTWVDEKVLMYPKYADEIYSRIGNIIFDKISKESALPYFEKVIESFDECYCISAVKKMEIYYKMYSRKIDKKVEQCEMEIFVRKLIDHILILTYGSQSVYSWSDYIHKLFPYDKWVELSSGILIQQLLVLVKSFLNGEIKESRLIINEKNINDFERCFDDYEGSKTPNLVVMNTNEYLIFLLAQGKTKIAQGEIQFANDIAYTFFELANIYKESFYKNVSMCFGLLIWSGASMAIGAYVEGMLSFVAAAERLLKIDETTVLHEVELVFTQFLYLYNRSFQMEISTSDLSLFEDYFHRFGYPKTLLYHIFGRYKDIIKQDTPEFSDLIRKIEETNIILVAKNESLNTIIFYDSLISSYYKIGEVSRAGVYLQRLYPSIIRTLCKYIDIAHHFLMRYSTILMELKEYDSAIKIFQSSLLLIEKLRGISFSSERSYLGDSADMIVRRVIYMICEKNRLSGGKLESNELLVNLLINLVPRSIIEERNGNYEMVIDELLLSKEKEYYQLFDLLNNMKEKSVSNLFYKQTADRFLETKRYLEKNHPKFRSLQPYSLIGCNDRNPFVFLESKLKEREVFYRNILVEDILVHVLVSKSSYSIYSEKINLAELKELLDCLENMINESVYNLEKMEFSSYVHLFEELTRMLYQPLMTQMDLFDTLYYMPDYKLLHVTPNFIRKNNKWGIECFDRIELVIDYNNVGSSKIESNKFPNKFFISNSTKGGLQEIVKTIDKFSSFIRLNQDERGHIVIQESVNILIVAAHGIAKEFGELYYGAKKLELSRKKQIDLNEFIEIQASVIENAIIIACGGGTPANDKIERNNGVWDSMLKKRVKYVLYCKWDVSTQHTNELLDTILQQMCLNEKQLSQALNIAQRNLIHLNPILWSGLEVWKNY